MTLWKVIVRPRVRKILAKMAEAEREKFRGAVTFLEEFGPDLEMWSRGKKAHALKNARHANLKELIIKSRRSAWRFAYYVDKKQVVFILSGGDKRGVSKKVFYRRLIDQACNEIDAIERGE